MPIDRVVLEGSVRGIADFAADAPRRLVDQADYPEDSVIAGYLRSNLNVPSYGDFPIVREALVAAMFASLSGVDHAQSWIDLVRGERATVSLATVTRGALEGLAKSYFLLSAPSTDGLISRHLAITAADLVHPLKHSEFQDYTGEIMDKKTFPQLHEQLASHLGLPLVTKPSAQGMVEELLSAGMQEGMRAGKEIYSQLSGPAHASASALGMYVEPGDAHIFLPPAIASEQAGYLFAGICVVVETWLELFAADSRDREEWRTARSIAESHLIRFIRG